MLVIRRYNLRAALQFDHVTLFFFYILWCTDELTLLRAMSEIQIEHSNTCAGIRDLPRIRWNWEFLVRPLFLGYTLCVTPHKMEPHTLLMTEPSGAICILD